MLKNLKIESPGREVPVFSRFNFRAMKPTFATILGMKNTKKVFIDQFQFVHAHENSKPTKVQTKPHHD